MTDPQTVIVYRNRTEEQLDKLLYDNPEFMMVVTGILLLIGLLVVAKVLWDAVTMTYRRRWRK